MNKVSIGSGKLGSFCGLSSDSNITINGVHFSEIAGNETKFEVHSLEVIAKDKNGKVLKTMICEKDQPLNISIEGNVDRIDTTNGSIEVKGKVNRVSTTNGNVTTGNVDGDVSSTNGEIHVDGNVRGSVKTMNGDISHNSH